LVSLLCAEKKRGNGRSTEEKMGQGGGGGGVEGGGGVGGGVGWGVGSATKRLYEKLKLRRRSSSRKKRRAGQRYTRDLGGGFRRVLEWGSTTSHKSGAFFY